MGASHEKIGLWRSVKMLRFVLALNANGMRMKNISFSSQNDSFV